MEYYQNNNWLKSQIMSIVNIKYARYKITLNLKNILL